MLVATIKKDLALLLRDRGAVMSLFLLPIVFIAVFGNIFGGDGAPDPIPLAVHHAPGDERAAAIVIALGETGLFEVRAADSAEAARAAAADDDAVGLILPAELDPKAGRTAELVLDPATPPQARAPIEGTIRAVVAAALYGPPPAVAHVTAPPGVRAPLEDVSGFQITVPANAVLFGFFLALTVGLSFLEERKTGTWRRILAAPVNRRVVLLAKLVPYVLVGLIQFAFLFGIGVVFFGLEIAGDLSALIALTVAVVICATSLGLMLASLGRSERQLGGLGSAALLVMGLLGGTMVPRLIMPDAMKTAGLFVPHGWALDGYFDVLVRSGTSIADIAPELGAILGFAALFATVGALRFRFES